MSDANRIYKLLRANLSADQSMTLAKNMTNILDDAHLVKLEDLVAGMKSQSSVLRVAKEPDARALELADKLIENVVARYPYYKATMNRTATAGELARILALNDKITYDVISIVMDWTFEDDFWQKQIRSGANFRKHFLRLLSNTQDAYQDSAIAEV